MFASRQSRVIGIDGAQGVAVTGEVELDGSQGVLGAQDIDFALTEALEFFQSVVGSRNASMRCRTLGSGRSWGCCKGGGIFLERLVFRVSDPFWAFLCPGCRGAGCELLAGSCGLLALVAGALGVVP